MEIYLVGGAVRDHLLGLPLREHDYVVVGSTPEALLQLGYKPVGKDFPVFLHPETKDEYALARTERKTGRGYTQFQFHSSPDVTLQEDLKRRDLTINAMAMTNKGEIVDFYGGQADLKNRVLRHVSNAFIEDPVRILRVARFYARFASLGFTIASETISLMRSMVKNDEINFLVAERVWQECQRALTERQPQRFFETLRMCDALKVLFPELNKLYGVPQPPQWHPEIDTGIHTMMVLQQAAILTEDPVPRFAALLHDLGKGETEPNLWPKHQGHEEKGVPLIRALCDRLRVPKNFRDLAVITARFHGVVHDAFQLCPDTILNLLEKTDAFRRPQRFNEFLTACVADSRGRPGYENNNYPQKEFLLSTLAAAQNVSIEELISEGISGEKIAEGLKKLRIKAIAEIKEIWVK